MVRTYLVSDGKLTLQLRPAGGGWYAVTCPFDSQVMTQARSVEEAFTMAYDALKALKTARAKLARRLGVATRLGRTSSTATRKANARDEA